MRAHKGRVRSHESDPGRVVDKLALRTCRKIANVRSSSSSGKRFMNYCAPFGCLHKTRAYSANGALIFPLRIKLNKPQTWHRSLLTETHHCNRIAWKYSGTSIQSTRLMTVITNTRLQRIPQRTVSCDAPPHWTVLDVTFLGYYVL